MTPFAWRAWLRRWNDALLAALDPSEVELYTDLGLSPARLESGWLGNPGAAEPDLAALEARLGRSLPPSYRQFLAESDGFLQPGNLVPRILSSVEVEWYRTRNQDAIQDWKLGASYFGTPPPVTDQEYFVYGQAQDPTVLRLEYLDSALEVSETEQGGTAVYLLNPLVVHGEEWEAWYFAHWLPGARRYRSFWDLMQAELEVFAYQVAHRKRGRSSRNR